MFFSGEQAKKQALERIEAQAAQQAAMSAIEAESKKVSYRHLFCRKRVKSSVVMDCFITNVTSSTLRRKQMYVHCIP